MNRRICIAIDGPAASGKGTVARQVAAALGYAWLDTGALYRAVALAALRAGAPLTDEAAVAAVARALTLRFVRQGEATRLLLDGEDVSEAIRNEAVGRGASDVAVHPAVRQALLQLQRDLAAGGGVVVDGRDIGTVVLPQAELKVFLVASAEERAARRSRELLARGGPVDPARVLAEIQARDLQDSSRAVAPLRRAEDAVELDSTHLDAEAVTEAVLALAAARGAIPEDLA